MSCPYCLFLLKSRSSSHHLTSMNQYFTGRQRHKTVLGFSTNSCLLENLSAICLSCDPSDALNSVAFSTLCIFTNQTALHHLLGKFPSFVYTQEIRKYCKYLWGNWAFINIFHMSLILKFQRNVLCHSCASPTHSGMCCQEVYSPLSFSSNSGSRRWHNTFRQSDVQYDSWRRNAKRQENKKSTVNRCQARFLLSQIAQI